MDEQQACLFFHSDRSVLDTSSGRGNLSPGVHGHGPNSNYLIHYRIPGIVTQFFANGHLALSRDTPPSLTPSVP